MRSLLVRQAATRVRPRVSSLAFRPVSGAVVREESLCLREQGVSHWGAWKLQIRRSESRLLSIHQEVCRRTDGIKPTLNASYHHRSLSVARLQDRLQFLQFFEVPPRSEERRVGKECRC